ncbi:hypothetical protein [Pseudonocardia sp. D17]|uniref:hypothetical protein n=1 Tax=Pseudonocardia sp. D17 TaxID=882661 RepID=UPI002B3C2039|nr:hypothetical protein PSD17_55320 [Pseudonocardia sp. D17]
MSTGEPTTNEADSDVHPWVKDLDGVWHLRPRGRGWYLAGEREDDAQAETLCGLWVPSAHVSRYRPDGTLCPACAALAGSADDTTSEDNCG